MRTTIRTLYLKKITIGGSMRFLSTALFIMFLLFISKQMSAVISVSSAKGIKAEIIHELNDAEEKITSLANDFPEAKYSWRPDDDVCSVSEAIMHASGANFFILSFAGVKMKERMKMDMDMEKKVTDKAQILEFIKKSFAFSREKIMATTDKELEKPIDFFGNKITTRHLLLKMVSNNHEHMGQLIAYARMNGIVPSWSKKDN